MQGKLDAAGLVRAAFFSLAPAASAAGAMALPVLISLAGAVSFRPAMMRAALQMRPSPLAFLLVFAAWVGASSLWSPYPDHAQAPKFVATVLLGLMFAAGANASTQARRLTRAGAIGAFVVLAALLTIEALGGMPLNSAVQPEAEAWVVARNPGRGAVVLLGAVWAIAAAGFAAGRPRLALATLAVAGALSAQFDQATNLVAFASSLGVFALALAAPRLALTAVSGGLAAWMLAAPFITPLLVNNASLVDRLPYSLAARAGMWKYVCSRIGESPWIGHGLDASRTITDTITLRGEAIAAIQLHPHSASLQIWFETGLIGAGLAAAALILGGRVLAKRLNRWGAAASAATLACYGLIANVGFGIWQEWWIAAMLLAGAVIAAFAARP